MKLAVGLTILFVALAGTALAQTKFSSNGKCTPDGAPKSMDIGDHPGHSYLIMKVNCTDDGEIGGLKSRRRPSS